MKNVLIGIFIGCIIAIICFAFANTFILLIKVGTLSAITSSPVEEMYHKQLVTTLDSILDAKINVNKTEEYIDSNNVGAYYRKLGNIFVPTK